MVRIAAAVTVVSSHFVSAKDDVILLQTKSFSSVEAGQREALDAMKTSMKDLLLDPEAMAGASNFVSGMQAEIEAMKVALDDQNTEDNTAVTEAVAVINQCNADRRTNFATDTSGVEARWTSVQGLLGSHADCRAAEATETGTENTRCDAKKAKAGLEKTTLQTCLDEASDPEGIAACLPARCVEAEHVNTAITACNNAKTALNSRVPVCDTAQADAENAFCTFASHLTDTCATFNNCYAGGVAAYGALQTKFEGKLVSQNEMWQSINHIECLFNLFKSDTRLQAQQVTDCLNTKVASKYTLNYPAAENQDICNTGRATWDAANYNGLEGVMTRQAETQGLEAIQYGGAC